MPRFRSPLRREAAITWSVDTPSEITIRGGLAGGSCNHLTKLFLSVVENSEQLLGRLDLRLLRGDLRDFWKP